MRSAWRRPVWCSNVRGSASGRVPAGTPHAGKAGSPGARRQPIRCRMEGQSILLHSRKAERRRPSPVAAAAASRSRHGATARGHPIYAPLAGRTNRRTVSAATPGNSPVTTPATLVTPSTARNTGHAAASGASVAGESATRLHRRQPAACAGSRRSRRGATVSDRPMCAPPAGRRLPSAESRAAGGNVRAMRASPSTESKSRPAAARGAKRSHQNSGNARRPTCDGICASAACRRKRSGMPKGRSPERTLWGVKPGGRWGRTGQALSHRGAATGESRRAGSHA